MFRYLNALLAVVALGALPGLSGCLGGGGGGSTAAPSAQMPREPAPAPAPAPRARAEPTPDPAADPEPDPAPAPRAAPTPIPPTQAPAPARTPVVAADMWRASGWKIIYELFFATSGSQMVYPYDTRGNPNLNYGPGPWSPWLSSRYNGYAEVSPLADNSGIRVARSPKSDGSEGNARVTVFESSGGAVSDVRTDGAVFGRVAWIDGDDDDGRWLSWGWWLDYRSGDFIANAPKALSECCNYPSFGAFVDGPEFRVSPASLPERGSATYRGPAMGVFASMVGDGGRDPDTGHTSFGPSGVGKGQAGSLYAGEFTGLAEMTMTYTGDNRANWATDIRISRMDGGRINRATGASENLVREFEASEGPAFRFVGTAWKSSNDGRDYITMVSSDRRSEPADSVVSGFGGGPYSGGTGGRIEVALSNVAGAGGSPRRAAGLFGYDVFKPNEWHSFDGVYVMPLQGVTP